MVTVYDFQGVVFYMHLCIRYTFCNTFIVLKFPVCPVNSDRQKINCFSRLLLYKFPRMNVLLPIGLK
ncbi:MAG: hypothetical protein BAA00_03345 [Parageobacillus thermoglucosidasius]|nr:MAG: hypothetical protein BAA00_03345 [Parageobacillus thermoglucosidasius]RDE31455.1 hypothetical protein DV713_15725 [Parageobacillus thermoglucosidasius]